MAPTGAVVPLGVLIENEGKCCIFAAVPDFMVGFLLTGQSGSFLELFVLVQGKKINK